MTQFGYAVFGLAVIVGILAGALTFAVLRFAAAFRGPGRHLRDTGADATLLSVALQDVVAKLKAEEQATSARAAASKQLSDKIVENLAAGLLVVERDGRIDILNPAGRRLLGVDDVTGERYLEGLPNAQPLTSVITECLTTMQPIVRRSLQMTDGGRASHLGVTVSPLDNAGGAICLFSDLTAVIELEKQLRLKEALATLGELTAGIAHEFRNGLATIHGYGRLIDPAQVPAAYRPCVEGIRQEAESMKEVVTRFLNFARPDQVSFTRLELEPLARRAGEDILRDLPVGTGVEVSGEFGEIQGDEVLLRQVFSNLIRNAAEACAGVGRTPVITIAGRVDTEQRTCGVAIDDNGPGIPDAVRERVFQPFFTTRAGGTGLGLAIVQKVVVTHNGRVAVGASSAGGARIQLTFPLAES
jgi:signal transduction histidine kinase